MCAVRHRRCVCCSVHCYKIFNFLHTTQQNGFSLFDRAVVVWRTTRLDAAKTYTHTQKGPYARTVHNYGF